MVLCIGRDKVGRSILLGHYCAGVQLDSYVVCVRAIGQLLVLEEAS